MRLAKAGTPLNLQANDGDEQRKEEPIESDVFENYDTLQRRGSQWSIYVTVALSQRSLDVNGDGEQSLWGLTESFSDLVGPC
jgi:hypothetical protein